MLEKCGPYSSGCTFSFVNVVLYTFSVLKKKHFANAHWIKIFSQLWATMVSIWVFWVFRVFWAFSPVSIQSQSLANPIGTVSLSILSIFATSEYSTTIFSRPAAVPAKAQTLFSAVLTILIKIYRFYNWLDCKKEIAFFEFSLVRFGDKNIIKYFQQCKLLPKERHQ